MRQAKRQLAGSGEALPAGAVGEVIFGEQNSLVNFGAANTTTGLVTITLSPGVWLISASQTVSSNGATVTAFSSIISDTSATASGVTGIGVTVYDLAGPVPTAAAGNSCCHPAFVLTLSASKTLYLNTYGVFTGGTPQRRGTIRAVRIA